MVALSWTDPRNIGRSNYIVDLARGFVISRDIGLESYTRQIELIRPCGLVIEQSEFPVTAVEAVQYSGSLRRVPKKNRAQSFSLLSLHGDGCVMYRSIRQNLFLSGDEESRSRVLRLSNPRTWEVADSRTLYTSSSLMLCTTWALLPGGGPKCSFRCLKSRRHASTRRHSFVIQWFAPPRHG